ncbi:flap endonuclease GEN homolog 1 isoform X2 [Aplysia californica]|nr:flap endonuclease GEN homolog 1 isoform X2 [Aplysia californica]
MGFPVIDSVGEAEKMCAELDRMKVVDGVLTEDGDALIYGAQNVYKGLFKESNKEYTATKYSMSDITARLGLTQKDLIAFALLSKGDFCDGVPGIGKSKFIDLVKEMKKNNVEDVLDRLLLWKDNERLSALEDLQRSLKGIRKSKHCTKCHHEGLMSAHGKSGCETCQLNVDCRERNEWKAESGEKYPECPCNYHKKEAEIMPYQTELKIRATALSVKQFPEQGVKEEYLNCIQDIRGELNTTMQLPDFKAVCDRMSGNFPSAASTLSHMLPAYTMLALHGKLADMEIKPLSIIKSCVKNFRPQFRVNWEKSGIKNLPSGDSSSYEFKVPAPLFEKKYPALVKQYNSNSKKSSQTGAAETGKRKGKVEEGNKRVTDFFQVVKSQKTRETKD